MRAPATRLLILAAVLGATGCRLVDQTSFGNAPRPPAPDLLTAALAAHGTEPVLVIRPEDGVPDEPMLRDTLETVQAHDHASSGSGRFRLEAVGPAGPDLDHEQAALARAAASARAVMDEMGADGVPADHVLLSTRSDPAVSQVELRLYPG